MDLLLEAMMSQIAFLKISWSDMTRVNSRNPVLFGEAHVCRYHGVCPGKDP